MPRLAALAAIALVCACGPRTLKQKLLNAEKRVGQAETSLDEADKYMAALEPEPAAEKLKEARDYMAHEDVGFYPERTMVEDRLAQAESRLDWVRAERAKRDLDEAVAKRKAEIEAELGELKEALGEARKKDAGGSQVRSLKGAIDDVGDELDDGKELEPKHQAYAKFAEAVRQKLEAAKKDLEEVQLKVSFAEGPGAKWLEAKELSARARAEKDKQRRAGLYAEAREKFRACQSEGQKLLAESEKLDGSLVVVGESTVKPSSVVASCTASADSVGRPPAKAKRSVKAKKMAKRR